MLAFTLIDIFAFEVLGESESRFAFAFEAGAEVLAERAGLIAVVFLQFAFVNIVASLFAVSLRSRLTTEKNERHTSNCTLRSA